MDDDRTPARAPAPTGSKSDQTIGCLAFLAIAAFIAYAIGAGGGDDGGGTAHTAATAGEFDQSWSKSYSSTTCADWANSMTYDQRRVAAADMLVGARKVDGGDSLPSDGLILSFAGDITEGCAISTMSITDAAVGVYLIGKDQYGP